MKRGGKGRDERTHLSLAGGRLTQERATRHSELAQLTWHSVPSEPWARTRSVPASQAASVGGGVGVLEERTAGVGQANSDLSLRNVDDREARFDLKETAALELDQRGHREQSFGKATDVVEGEADGRLAGFEKGELKEDGEEVLGDMGGGAALEEEIGAAGEVVKLAR